MTWQQQPPFQHVKRRRQQHQGKLPTAWEQLIGYGGLKVFPEDPLGAGYTLDATGELQVADHIDIRKQE